MATLITFHVKLFAIVNSCDLSHDRAKPQHKGYISVFVGQRRRTTTDKIHGGIGK